MHAVPALRGLRIGGEPDAWLAAGFAVVDGRFVAGGVTIELVPDAPQRVLGWDLEHPSPADVEDLRAVEVAPAPPAGPHPNGVTAVDHVVAGTSDLERTTGALGRLGITPRRTVVGARGDAATAYRFFLLGTAVLELIGPTEPAGDRPARFWGVAFVADDVDRLGPPWGPAHDAVQPGRRIASLDRVASRIDLPVAVLTPRVR